MPDPFLWQEMMEPRIVEEGLAAAIEDREMARMKIHSYKRMSMEYPDVPGMRKRLTDTYFHSEYCQCLA